MHAKPPCNATAIAGRPVRALSRAASGKKTPSLAIAYTTKGNPRETVFRIPAAETTMAAATTLPAQAPRAMPIASAAGLLLDASPS